MKSVVILLIFIGYIIFRDIKTFEQIPENGSLTDKFNKCNDNIDCMYPIKYHIMSFDKVTVRLLNFSGSSETFYMLPNIPYSIDLLKHFNSGVGSCNIETINNNNFSIIVKRSYEYPSLLKFYYTNTKSYILKYW